MKRLLILATLLAIMSTLIGCSTPPSTEPSSKPTTAPQAVAPTATPQAAAPTATPQAVAPTDTPQVSEPTATAQAETTDSTASDEYTVNIDPADFVDVIDNPYLPRIPGSKYVYEGQTEEGLERIEVEILSETREVMGITATVVRDRAYLEGELIEDTHDWFAQDKEGNVWYLGEEVDNYENGEIVNHDGAWEAGVDGALPGIIMHANPSDHVGEPYHQEYYEGEAEDMGEVLSVQESVTVPAGSFEDVLQILDSTPLEPDVLEHKFFAEGVGEIKAVDLSTGEEFVLIEFTPAGSASTASDEYTVNIDPADFVDVIDNPYLPFLVGSKHVYEGTTQEGLERIELEVLPEKREIMGIQTTIVRDRVTINGELFEDTFDWFAQDKDGNVWVFGEEVTFYENGQVLSTEGSWEAGVDGALPGIAMYADPAAHVGETYRIEYYPGEAVSKSRTLLPHRQKYPVR